jgi:hypothetical protein
MSYNRRKIPSCHPFWTMYALRYVQSNFTLVYIKSCPVM